MNSILLEGFGVLHRSAKYTAYQQKNTNRLQNDCQCRSPQKIFMKVHTKLSLNSENIKLTLSSIRNKKLFILKVIQESFYSDCVAEFENR